VRGRPVAAALAERWPDWTWECSHVGGDRFAANLVLLPDGAYYGYLDAESAVRVVEAHLRGEVEVDHLRGLSTEPPLVQAAVVAAMRRWGPVDARAFRSDTIGAVAGDQGGGGAWSVELTGTPGAGVPSRVRATVRRTTRPAELLTCQARTAAAATAYEVSDLREVADLGHGAG
jgi:(2Fe-2S) ferredoxin